MKAIIKLNTDVPDWQIGQPVTVYFPDTMKKTGICKSEEPVKPSIERAIYDHDSWHYVCGGCDGQIDIQDNYCRHCGRAVEHFSNRSEVNDG